MAHDHNYAITFLKTPFGFLTKTGFTEDINSEEIVLLPSNSYGKWSSMKRRLDFFTRKTSLDSSTIRELYARSTECETMEFLCEHGTYCEGCRFKRGCDFWSGKRDTLKFYKLYSL